MKKERQNVNCFPWILSAFKFVINDKLIAFVCKVTVLNLPCITKKIFFKVKEKCITRCIKMDLEKGGWWEEHGVD